MFASAAFLAILPTTRLMGDSPVIKSAGKGVCKLGGAGPHSISVYFSDAGPLAQDVANPDNWTVRLFYASGSPSHTVVLENPVGTNALSGSNRADLRTMDTIMSGAASTVIQYSGPVGASTYIPCQTSSSVDAAGGKDDADIYLDGSVTPTVGAGPQYDIDTSVGLKLSRKHPKVRWFEITGAVATDQRQKADPDSFRWRLAYQIVPSKVARPQYDLGLLGMEFDRTGEARNLIASPRVIIPFGPNPKVDSNGVPKVVMRWELYGGVEAGWNTKDILRFAGTSFPGHNAIFRGVPGSTLYLRWFRVGPFQEISVDSNYEVRLLATREIFLETRLHTTDPVPELRQQPRHHIKTTVAFKFSGAAALTVKYEYGSLPPAFTFVQHQVAIGILLQLKQNRALRL
jgi:hypothetical protein